MSPELVKKMKNDLQPLQVSGVTIHFSPEKPLQKSIIKKILIERIKEIKNNE
jgi:hypothetical protein